MGRPDRRWALFAAGGLAYVLLELLWRGRTHWTMFLLGGACFVAIGMVNEVLPWETPLWRQMLAGACATTALEFLAGCAVNLWLGWGVWDYGGVPGNILGQVCPRYAALWFLVSLPAIVLDDCLRHLWLGEEPPRYNVGLTRGRPRYIRFFT